MRGCRAPQRPTGPGTRTDRYQVDAAHGRSDPGQPRYTGRQGWNRQPSEAVLVDPANTGLGTGGYRGGNLPEGRVISKHPAHAALVSETDFITAQEMTAPRGPVGPAVRRTCWPGSWPAACAGAD